jgi:hypothetical protein
MSLIKKIDVKKHFAAQKQMKRAASRLVSQPGQTKVSEVKPAGARSDNSDFVEDFSLEHSSSSGSIA